MWVRVGARVGVGGGAWVVFGAVGTDRGRGLTDRTGSGGGGGR